MFTWCGLSEEGWTIQCSVPVLEKNPELPDDIGSRLLNGSLSRRRKVAPNANAGTMQTVTQVRLGYDIDADSSGGY